MIRDDDLYNPRRFAWQDGRPIWRRLAGAFYWHPQGHLLQMYAQRSHIDRYVEFAETFADLIDPDDPGTERGSALYNLACAYSLAGQAEQAIATLKTALSSPDLVEWSKQDTDLDPLRDRPGFQALYQSLPQGSGV